MGTTNKILDILIDTFIDSIHSRELAEFYYDLIQPIIDKLDKINRKLNTKFKLKKRSKRANTNKPKVTLAMIRGYADTLSNDDSSNLSANALIDNDDSSPLSSTVNIDESGSEGTGPKGPPYYCHIL
jgi:hypothetical protein